MTDADGAPASYTGGCLCGGIRFRIDAELEPIQLCHCLQCRKAQGGPFVAVVPVAVSAFDLLEGDELLKAYESSPGKRRFFCERCGSPIYSRRDAGPDVIRVRAGLFDGPLRVRPASHAHVDSRCNWWSIDDGLPQHREGRQGAGASIVRPATRADIAQIFAVRYAVRENTLRRGVIDDEDVRREIEDSGRGWVVEADGEVVAFAIGNADTGNIWALFVQPEFEGRGFGHRLHREMVQWLWSCGLAKLWLTTGSDTRARSFYERRGWRCVGPAENGQVRLELGAPTRGLPAG